MPSWISSWARHPVRDECGTRREAAHGHPIGDRGALREVVGPGVVIDDARGEHLDIPAAAGQSHCHLAADGLGPADHLGTKAGRDEGDTSGHGRRR